MISEELTIGLPAPQALRLDGTALFLDLDGTLAPIAARPQDVRPDPRRTSLLSQLVEALDGRVAVVSGRTLADVDRILEGAVTAAPQCTASFGARRTGRRPKRRRIRSSAR